MIKPLKKRDKFRSKKLMCDEIARLLTEGFSYGTVEPAIRYITSVWTEFDGHNLPYGNKKGCRYWSGEAIKVQNDKSKFTHEHTVPRKHIISKLIDMKKPTSSNVSKLMNEFCVGTIITYEEDKRLCGRLYQDMPEDWDGEDVWARYREVGIEVYDVWE